MSMHLRLTPMIDTTTDPQRRLVLKVAALLGAGSFGSPLAMASPKQAGRSMNGSPTMHRVQFISAGSRLTGWLCVPSDGSGKCPGIVLLGPFGYVKEQSPAEYATRLANAGFVTLIFDPRGNGESEGSPRRHESPAMKIADTQAALAFIAARPEVDAARIGALGICQGCSEMIALAAIEPRIKALALVSGQYLYRENIEKFFSGGGPTLDQRITRGRVAKVRYDTDNQLEYTAVVSATDQSAGLPWPPINDWYIPWTSLKWGAASLWENRYTTMSDAEVWTFDVDTYAHKLTTPALIVHGEHSDGGPEAAQHVYDLFPGTDKHLHIVPGIFHTRFYDDPLVIEPAVAEVAAWFTLHLS